MIPVRMLRLCRRHRLYSSMWRYWAFGVPVAGVLPGFTAATTPLPVNSPGLEVRRNRRMAAIGRGQQRLIGAGGVLVLGLRRCRGDVPLVRRRLPCGVGCGRWHAAVAAVVKLIG